MTHADALRELASDAAAGVWPPAVFAALEEVNPE